MRAADILENLRNKLAMPGGRHLYGVLGTYFALEYFGVQLRQATTAEGRPFPDPISVNRSILDSIPNDEFLHLVEHEAVYPEPTVAHVRKAFESFLRKELQKTGLVVLSNLEMLFAYGIDLQPLRTLAADESRVVLLLPGRRESGRIIMFPGWPDGDYSLPVNLIAENHLWELDEHVQS